MLKKIVGIASLPLLALGILGGPVVSAENLNQAGLQSSGPVLNSAAPLKVSIDRGGTSAVIEGVVVSTNPFVVQSWGGDWSIADSNSVRFERENGQVGSVNDFRAGDSVRIEGRAAIGDINTVVADRIKNREKHSSVAGASAVAVPVAAAPVDGQSYHGTISGIDPGSHSFWLNSQESGRMHIFATDQTTLDGRSDFFNNLTNGMGITLNGVRDNQHPGNVLALTLASRGNLNVVNARGNANLDQSVTDNSNSNNRANVDASAQNTDNSTSNSGNRTDASSQNTTDASTQNTDNSTKTKDSANRVDASSNGSDNSSLGTGF